MPGSLWQLAIMWKWEIHIKFFVLFCLFRASLSACGSSQARDRIRTVAASLHHSHSNTGSLTHRVRPGIEPVSSWILVGFMTAEPWQELPTPSKLIGTGTEKLKSHSFISHVHGCGSISIYSVWGHRAYKIKSNSKQVKAHTFPSPPSPTIYIMHVILEKKRPQYKRNNTIPNTHQVANAVQYTFFFFFRFRAAPVAYGSS